MPLLSCFSNEEMGGGCNTIDKKLKLGLKQMQKDIRNK